MTVTLQVSLKPGAKVSTLVQVPDGTWMTKLISPGANTIFTLLIRRESMKIRKFSPRMFIFAGVLCFALGYAFANVTDRTNWVGFLTYGVEVDIDPMVRPRPSGLSSAVSGEIKIGLREDGVVVWKQAEQASE